MKPLNRKNGYFEGENITEREFFETKHGRV